MVGNVGALLSPNTPFRTMISATDLALGIVAGWGKDRGLITKEIDGLKAIAEQAEKAHNEAVKSREASRAAERAANDAVAALMKETTAFNLERAEFDGAANSKTRQLNDREIALAGLERAQRAEYEAKLDAVVKREAAAVDSQRDADARKVQAQRLADEAAKDRAGANKMWADANARVEAMRKVLG